jgi:dTDP-glucose pyrophosphorylase
MINILIPMAGSGSRFNKAGYLKNKPFIDVAGKPMILRVLENLNFPNANYILVARREHLQAEAQIVHEIKQQYKVTFVEIEALTEGTACSVLFARSIIDNETPLLIANSDQIVDFSLQEFINDCRFNQLDGSIMTFIDDSRNPKWSFARVDINGRVQEVKEKEVISEFATVGIYFFSRGADFVDAAIEMILNQDRVNNEYYTCPTYNYLIKKGKKIGIYNVSKTSMHGIGSPEDLNNFLDLCQKNNKDFNNKI